MMNQLNDYIMQGLAKGFSEDQLRKALVEQKIPTDQIDEAFVRYKQRSMKSIPLATKPNMTVPIIVATILDIFGFLIGVILVLLIRIPILLIVPPALAYLAVYVKYKDIFWKSFLLSLVGIVLLVILFIVLMLYTPLGDIILELFFAAFGLEA